MLTFQPSSAGPGKLAGKHGLPRRFLTSVTQGSDRIFFTCFSAFASFLSKSLSASNPFVGAPSSFSSSSSSPANHPSLLSTHDEESSMCLWFCGIPREDPRPSEEPKTNPTPATISSHRRRNPEKIFIYNATDFTIALKDIFRQVERNPPRMELKPGERKPLPAFPSATYVRVGVFLQNKDLKLYLHSEDIADMPDEIAIRYDATSQKFYFDRNGSSDPPTPNGSV